MTELRKVFANTMNKMMTDDSEVVYLEADLAGAIGTVQLLEQFPNQAFDLGIMEANMVGVGAGMSLKGKIPFVHSFGTFASRRCADQTFMAGCYNKANIKIVGSDPGISAEANGGTHMPFEDIGIYRSYPEMTILDVAEPYLLEQVLHQMKNNYGTMYIRFPRKDKETYYTGTEEIKIGKGNTLKEGTEATIIASGIEVKAALEAAEELEKENISVRVVDMFTIKPLDKELVLKCARETGAIVTAENHNKQGGLGSAVAEVLAEEARVPFRRIGVPDCFGEVGSRKYLAEKFGLTAKDIVERVKQVINEKKNSDRKM
ncbi:1-deoxy-D-xylulose-5-phosphate synthase [uncultured Clostridium sp.]|uniref:Transketolase family protein n=1 Tax=Muricoprocola aceti TaxID=2981772 RepID=A0ABT2SKX2_9FIRM|nr:transketolase C-terminal domain-containing protein [Muricoprocola aceti]MCU6725156.1 transketolase family protein [Muricoprocola aceti]RGD65413.1 transketolase family protein [Lachnospiraceae bacterium OF09-6]SCH41466.1 1-deoxy-D-xylulose-5-phosphate synthase [uncultured Clostridium sp.]